MEQEEDAHHGEPEERLGTADRDGADRVEHDDGRDHEREGIKTPERAAQLRDLGDGGDLRGPVVEEGRLCARKGVIASGPERSPRNVIAPVWPPPPEPSPADGDP